MESSSTTSYDLVGTIDRGRDQAWAVQQSNATSLRLSQARTLQPHRVHESHTLSRMRREKSLPHSQELDRLVQILKENEVPGPQLFRLQSEFCKQLGNPGGQGTVYGISKLAHDEYKKAGHTVFERWRVNLIAIKQYKRARTANQWQGHDHRGIEEQLSNRFRDAACEAFALSPSRFRNHPNIVQLRGWGLCLDTLENPTSQCCSSLQVPMLILEKADMNLAQFLQRKHPTRHNLRDIESGSDDASPDAPSAYKWLASAFAEDPYEIIRLLCIDIGHGLGAIHHHKFSHGDLKPENILVFRPGNAGGNTKWVAKICDFGLSSGEDDPSSTGQRYTGTKVWQPPQKQIENSLSAEDLRKCDVYVYGLIVWSAFFHRGEHRWPWVAKELEESLGSLSRRALRKGIKDLVEGAMKELEERKIEPWKSLYTGREDRHFKNQPLLPHLAIEDPLPTGNDLETGSWFYWPQLRSKQPPALPLSRREVARVPKAERQGYNNKDWWKTNNFEGDSESPVDADTLADSDVQTAESAHRTPTVDPKGDTSNQRTIPSESSYEPPETPLEGMSHLTTVSSKQLPTGSRASSRVVSLVARDVDDWPLSTDEFTSERRKGDVKEVHAELLQLVAQERWCLALAQELYFYARYRSRMKYAWWSECAPETNVLGRALNLIPAVDICTLAWLAKGKIGNWEATNLATNWDFWGSILDPDKYDESEILSRMLLLIQAGAPVERKLYGAGGNETILMAYIRRCRSVIIPVVVVQLQRLFWHRLRSGIITTNTEDYITGVGKASSRSRTTLLWDMRLSPSIDSATCLAVEVILGQNTSISTARPSQSNKLLVERPAISTETTALLLSQLPVGWIEHRVDNKKDPGKSIYEEVFTQSFTLKKPGFACSLVQSGEIKIGDLSTNRVVSYLALPSLLQRSRGKDGGSGGTASGDIAARFPMYDESWFMSEWLSDLPQVDVLGTINPWVLPSFTIRIPNINIMETVSFNFRRLAHRIWRLMKGLAILLAGLALCVAAVVLLLFLLWVFLPIFLLEFLVWGPIILNAYMLANSDNQDRSSAVRALPFTIAFIPGGAILGVLIVDAICSSALDGITYEKKECKQCLWMSFEYMRCYSKNT